MGGRPVGRGRTGRPRAGAHEATHGEQWVTSPPSIAGRYRHGLLLSQPTGERIARLTRITGLGEGVDRSGVLLPDAIERALAVLREYRELMDHHDVQEVRMVGTSALRDATNRASFSIAAEEIVGTQLMLLSGDEEASLSFLGATSELRGAGGPWLVADIGGGSTELVVGTEATRGALARHRLRAGDRTVFPSRPAHARRVGCGGRPG